MKKRILLVNPHIEDFAAYDHFSKPLGLLRLAAYLKPCFDLHFIDAMNRTHPGLTGMKFRENGTGHFYKTVIPKPGQLSDIPRRFKRYGLPDDLFRDRLRDTPFRPDYIFVTSVMTYWYTGVLHTIGLIREEFTKVSAKKDLTSDGQPCLQVSGEVTNYETAELVDTAIGPLEECIVRAKLTDADTQRVLAVANLVARAKSTTAGGVKNLSEGVGKALSKWLKTGGLQTEEERKEEQKS